MIARDRSIFTVLAAALAALLVLLAGGILSRADAQGDGAAGNIVCVVGQVARNDLPIILVDAAEQTIMVYLYDYAGDDLELVSTRTYRYDRLLSEFNNEDPSVEDVRKRVRDQEK